MSRSFRHYAGKYDWIKSIPRGSNHFYSGDIRDYDLHRPPKSMSQFLAVTWKIDRLLS